MGNDSPDWTDTVTTPAIPLGSQKVNANSTATLGPYSLPAGTHALKIYINGLLTGLSPTEVQVLDTANVNPILDIIGPTSPFIFLAVDDVSTPQVEVTITTSAGSGAWTVSVLAMLSDQAVDVNNTATSPVPVDLPNESTVVPWGTDSHDAIVVTPAPNTNVQTVPINHTINAGAALVLLPTVVANQYYLLGMTVSALAPAAALVVALETTAGNVIAVMVFDTTKPQPVWSFDFRPGSAGVLGEGVQLVNTGANAIQLGGALTYTEGPF